MNLIQTVSRRKLHIFLNILRFDLILINKGNGIIDFSEFLIMMERFNRVTDVNIIYSEIFFFIKILNFPLIKLNDFL